MSSERMRIPWEDQGKYNKIITQGSEMWTEIIYDGNGNIDEKQTYNPRYLEQLRKEREAEEGRKEGRKKERKEERKEEREEEEQSDSKFEKCMKWILLSPFKLLWWLIKLVFWIVFWSWLSSVLGISKDDN